MTKQKMTESEEEAEYLEYMKLKKRDEETT